MYEGHLTLFSAHFPFEIFTQVSNLLQEKLPHKHKHFKHPVLSFISSLLRDTVWVRLINNGFLDFVHRPEFYN
jgi:hypothetical protein